MFSCNCNLLSVPHQQVPGEVCVCVCVCMCAHVCVWVCVSLSFHIWKDPLYGNALGYILFMYNIYCIMRDTLVWGNPGLIVEILESQNKK